MTLATFAQMKVCLYHPSPFSHYPFRKFLILPHNFYRVFDGAHIYVYIYIDIYIDRTYIDMG